MTDVAIGGIDRLGGSWALVGRAAILDRFVAILADPFVATSATPVGIALVGPAGVGKTRLAAECLSRAAGDGWRTARIVGSRTVSAIPFGAAVPLLSVAEHAGEDAATTIRRAHQALTEPGRLCMLVDDVDLLDDASSTLVQQVAASAGVTIIVTACSERASSGLLTALWRDGAVARIDMEGLDRAEHDSLVASVLGGAMGEPAARWLHEASGGNPLFIRELLMSAAEDNSLVKGESGTWQFTRPVRASSRLAEVVAGRIGSLDDNERQCLDSIAIAEPIGLDVIEAMGLGIAVSRLERRRLIHAVQTGRRIDFVTSHPLYAEVVRDRLRPLRGRRLRRGLVEAVESRPTRRAGDAMRIATWRLEAGLADSSTNLLAAANEALVAGNLDNAERFARAAHETEPSGATALAIAQSLFRARNGSGAEGVLGMPYPASDEQVRAAIAVLRAKNMFWLLGRDDDAEAILTAALGEISDEAARRALIETAAELHACGEHELDIDAANSAPVHLRVLDLAARGRFADALAFLRSSSHDEVAMMALEAFVLVEGGWLADGRALAERAVHRSHGARIVGEGWAHFAIGTALIADGDGAAALESFRNAGALFDRHSDPLPHALCTSRAVFSLLLLGDIDEARRFLGRVPPHARQRIFAEQLDRAHAAVAVAEGNASEAAAQLRKRIDAARGRGHFGVEQTCLHDLVRLDVADSRERARVVALAAPLATPLAALRARHAGSGSDGIKLAETANEAERDGFAVWACELASAATARLAASGNVRASAAEQRRVTRLRAGFPRALLMTASGSVPETGIELRPGERQVAVLAAQGLSDREIAERLVLSIRTVGNYLGRVYRRLGISGRDELAAALTEAE